MLEQNRGPAKTFSRKNKFIKREKRKGMGTIKLGTTKRILGTLHTVKCWWPRKLISKTNMVQHQRETTSIPPEYDLFR